jgi:hypothetical protein
MHVPESPAEDDEIFQEGDADAVSGIQTGQFMSGFHPAFQMPLSFASPALA